ncbi:MAG: 3-hydroxyacyl-CoA dehydrogenase family protein [Desulfobacterales bacterium]|nr:MAG: 3-hydroxyacyl-CoA dehydrogenase family protein [Desulfobacterales bacterium]
MKAEEVQQVAVIGAGVMGHSIAQVFAWNDIEVNLVDVETARLEHAVDLIKAELDTLAAHGRITFEDIPAILGRIRPTTDLAAAAAGVDFALESVAEVPEVKQHVFAQLNRFCPEAAVLASNTSSLDIFRIVPVGRPERLVTTHWFAPPNIIPLVEVAPGPQTAPAVVNFTADLMERLGKKPVVMQRFVPGFIVNRIQRSIRQAVLEMLSNGWATPAEIDLAVKTSLGIRLPVVGVVQSMDFTGLDLLADIAKGQGDASAFITDKVSRGHLGAKTSQGIFDYGGRSEIEILKKRDRRYLQTLDHLLRINAFEPV